VFNASAPAGTLWSTSTTINNLTWGYVLSVYEPTAWAASVALVDVKVILIPPCIIIPLVILCTKYTG
jgi:hypothetical protein